MENYQIYYDNKLGLYYFFNVEGKVNCSKCNKELEEECYFLTDWNKKAKTIEGLRSNVICCSKCVLSYSQRGSLLEKKTCTIIKYLPLKKMKDCILLFEMFPPELSDGGRNCSIFEIDRIMKNSTAEIIDHTRLAGRTDVRGIEEVQKSRLALQKRDEILGYSFQIAQARIKDTKGKFDEIESKGVNVDDFFDNLKSSFPILQGEEPHEAIERKERPLIEEKRLKTDLDYYSENG